MENDIKEFTTNKWSVIVTYDNGDQFEHFYSTRKEARNYKKYRNQFGIHPPTKSIEIFQNRVVINIVGQIGDYKILMKSRSH